MPPPDAIRPDSPALSQRKLLAFAGVVALIFGGTLVTGYVQRDHFRSLGGNLHVHVMNDSPVRYRTDLIVDGAFTTLELEPGEKALVRYAPHRLTEIELRQFRKNNPVGSAQAGPFEPGQTGTVVFHLKDAGVIDVKNELPVAGREAGS